MISLKTRRLCVHRMSCCLMEGITDVTANAYDTTRDASYIHVVSITICLSYFFIF